MDTLAVTLGAKISALVPGFVSTEVDPRLSFDMEASVAKGRRIISLYEERVRAGEK
jgi:transaldolase